MQKIISLFQRNYDGDRLVRNEVVPGAEWVLAGEGRATRKFDGTCCLVVGGHGKLFKRYEVKPGGKPPAGFVPANEVDATTGKQQGWLPVGDGPEDRWHREACEYGWMGEPLADGTYELLGPRVQGDPEKAGRHMLVPHGYLSAEDQTKFAGVPRDFEGIKAWLDTAGVEGIVWHHPDGRMVKIKRRDFWRTKADRK